MGTYYVYSPINGTVWNQDNYCAGGQHRIVTGLGGTQGMPVDIGGAQAQAVKFTASSNVKSIRIERLDGHVCLTDTGDQDNGVHSHVNAGGHGISTVARQPTTFDCNNKPYFTTSTWVYKFTNSYSDTSPCPA